MKYLFKIVSWEVRFCWLRILLWLVGYCLEKDQQKIES